MEIAPPTWDGILSAIGAVVGGAIGAGGAALGVFWQLGAERKRYNADTVSFREGVATELAERASQLIIARTAIAAAIESGPPALDAIISYSKITSPSLFQHAGDRLRVLTERERGALVAFYESVDDLSRQLESARQFGWQNLYMWPQQAGYLQQACQSSCVFGAEALAEMFGHEKHPNELRLRDAAYINAVARLGAQAAIKQQQEALRKSRVGAEHGADATLGPID